MSELEISKIEIAADRRHLGDVTELAISIKEVGLLNPITITPKNKLIAGHHRIKAFQVLGFESIPVRVIDCTQLQAELAEIDENLMRIELSQLDQGIQLARRKAIYLKLHPKTAKGASQANGSNKAQGQKNDVGDTVSFTSDTAEKVNQSQRTVERKTKLGALEENKTEIEAAGIENNQKELTALLKLKKSNPDIVNKVLSAIQNGTAKTVKESVESIMGVNKEIEKPLVVDEEEEQKDSGKPLDYDEKDKKIDDLKEQIKYLKELNDSLTNLAHVDSLPEEDKEGVLDRLNILTDRIKFLESSIIESDKARGLCMNRYAACQNDCKRYLGAIKKLNKELDMLKSK